MKLQIVPSRQGFEWVRLGVRTFWRQPLAMSGLFFMFMATASLLSIVPLLGTALTLALVPAVTLGLMTATREAEQGRFPMPMTLLSAFRGGPVRTRAMLTLGAGYALALLLVMALSASLTGDAPALATLDENATPEQVRAAMNLPALWLALLLYLPVLLAFWHAPPLVFWHDVTPAKSLFFSLTACWRNKGAMLAFGAAWLGVFMLGGLAVTLLAGALGGGRLMAIVMYPMALFMASMFHTSLYFTFRDSFLSDAGDVVSTPTDGDVPPS